MNNKPDEYVVPHELYNPRGIVPHKLFYSRDKEPDECIMPHELYNSRGIVPHKLCYFREENNGQNILPDVKNVSTNKRGRNCEIVNAVKHVPVNTVIPVKHIPDNTVIPVKHIPENNDFRGVRGNERLERWGMGGGAGWAAAPGTGPGATEGGIDNRKGDIIVDIPSRFPAITDTEAERGGRSAAERVGEDTHLERPETLDWGFPDSIEPHKMTETLDWGQGQGGKPQKVTVGFLTADGGRGGRIKGADKLSCVCHPPPQVLREQVADPPDPHEGGGVCECGLGFDRGWAEGTPGGQITADGSTHTDDATAPEAPAPQITDGTAIGFNGQLAPWADASGGRGGWMDVTSLPGGGLRVSCREQPELPPRVFTITNECARGSCTCIFHINSSQAQLRPCRVFCEAFLRGDTDPDWEYILRGVVFGFSVINPDCETAYLPTLRQTRDREIRGMIQGKLEGEIDRGCISVVDQAPPCVHNIFCVPKDDGGGRAIVDCSRPKGRSVNDFTDTVAVKFSYKSVDEVVELMEQGDYMSTIDIKDAYRAVSIHPRDRERQGLHWIFRGKECTYMKDNRLCMGLSSSPYVFSKISDFIVRCAIREGIGRVVNYLDDFCIVSTTLAEGCIFQERLIAILRRIGFHISFKKLQSPATTVRFLGIEIDSVGLEMRLPGDKLSKLIRILEQVGERKRVSRRELEKLGGLLAHCSKVVRGGRTFCRRIYDAISSVREPHFSVRLSSGFREDIAWWRGFAAKFNGRARVLGKFAAHLATYSDASDFGYGALHGCDWIAGAFSATEDDHLGRAFPDHHLPPDRKCATAHINVREMWAAFAAALRWGERWRNCSITMVTDSTTVMSALNTGRSGSPEIMHFLRRLFWVATEHNFHFDSVFIGTRDNVICDALSRLDDRGSADRIAEADPSGSLCCR